MEPFSLMMIITTLNIFNIINTYSIIHLNYDKMTKKYRFHGLFRLYWTQKKNKKKIKKKFEQTNSSNELIEMSFCSIVYHNLQFT